jgi:hypothetical protein
MANKYEYFHVLQGQYGHGWEDLAAGTFREMRQNRKEYRDNEGGSYRIIKRRELNPAYKGLGAAMKRRVGSTTLKRTIGGWVDPKTRLIYRRRGSKWCAIKQSAGEQFCSRTLKAAVQRGRR